MSAQEEGNMSDDGISYRGGLNEDDVDEARVEQEFQEEYADFDALGARSRNVDVDLMRKALLNEKVSYTLLQIFRQNQILETEFLTNRGC